MKAIIFSKDLVQLEGPYVYDRFDIKDIYTIL